MAKSAKHDRQEAIQKATYLFWERGFHATSMRNLHDVTGMHPGSIYASFGSKEGLFRETLQCYADSSLSLLASCVEQTASPLEALRTFVKRVVVGYRQSSPSGICMLVKTVSELTEENAELLDESRRLLGEIERAFGELLTQAQAAGEIDGSKDTGRLARFLQMQLMGLRAYTRANECQDRINEMIDDLFGCLQ